MLFVSSWASKPFGLGKKLCSVHKGSFLVSWLNYFHTCSVCRIVKDWSSEINKLLFSACVISPEAVCRFSHLQKYVNLNQVHLPVNSLHAV